MTRATATLAGGCFWCLEAAYQQVAGVERVESGYTGGHTEDPTYHQVCSGRTGHAEAVQVTYDEEVVSYRDLLTIFFTIHDPTTLNRQGADVGTQYRSAIFYHSPAQAQEARELVAELEAAQLFAAPIVTEIVPLRQWYPAERYHHAYFARNATQPYCQAVIAPKLAKLRARHAALLRADAT